MSLNGVLKGYDEVCDKRKSSGGGEEEIAGGGMMKG